MENQKQKNTINILYITLILSTILSFVPNATAQGLSLVLVIAVLLCAYVTRSKESEDSLLWNHMTYLIGTVWIGTSFILLGTLIAGLWVYLHGDSTAIQDVITRLEGGWMPTEEGLVPVIEQYLADNQSLLLQASLVAIGPAILYFVYRVANGYSRAMKGYRIAKPKSWL